MKTLLRILKPSSHENLSLHLLRLEKLAERWERRSHRWPQASLLAKALNLAVAALEARQMGFDPEPSERKLQSLLFPPPKPVPMPVPPKPPNRPMVKRLPPHNAKLSPKARRTRMAAMIARASGLPWKAAWAAAGRKLAEQDAAKRAPKKPKPR